MRKTFYKAILVLLACTFSLSNLWAQAPQKMSYQAVIRNSNNELVKSATVSMRISILQGSATGTAVYTETQTPTTNANGLISIEIGGQAGFDAINWASGVYFIKTETDPAGGSNYSISGTSQLLSVPYALYAKSSGTAGDKGPQGDKGLTGDKGATGDKGEAGDPAILFDNTQALSTKTWTSDKINTELTAKVDKETGKDLSTEDYTTAEKTKLAGIAEGAEVNVNADWNATGGDAQILNKPTIPEAQVQTNWTASTGMGVILNKPANIDEDKTDDVTTSGNQTIAGSKTFTGTNVFTGTTTVATPANATDAATKAYVDALKQQIKVLENTLITAGTYKLEDVEGNKYNVVKIGTQVWMAENLKTTKYADGTSIPIVNTTSTWDALTATSKAYCWYNDDIANKATYGALYTWAAAMNGAASVTANPSGIQGVCPTGWHLPSDAEWTQMENYLTDNGHNYDGTTGGGSTKIAKSLASTSGWNSSSTTGAVGNTDYPTYRNKSGFTTLPGGFRDGHGAFFYVGGRGYWWSATEYDATFARFRLMNYDYSYVHRFYTNKEVGFSVRCVRD